jgi:hypothetical protein
MIVAPRNTLAPLQLTIEPHFEDRGIRVFIKQMDVPGTLIETVDLNHIGFAAYTNTFDHDTEEYLVATFVVYTDGTYTTIDPLIARTSKIYRIKDDAPTLVELEIAGLGKVNYLNRFTTTFLSATNEQQVITWSERDGQIAPDATDCTITVRDASGAIQFSDFVAAPNADGIFFFKKTFTPIIDENYYILITTLVDGDFRTSAQTFFTIG